MPENIKIVFTDIDDTVFSHRTRHIPTSTIRAIEDLQAKGIKVFLCSGRNFYLIRKSGILDVIHPDGLITMNGSNAIIDGTTIFRQPMPSEVVDKMIRFAKRLKFGLTLIEESEGHINMIDERVISAHEKYNTRFPQPRTFPDHYDRVVYQMIAFCDEFEEELFLPHLKDCKSARWDEYAVDIRLKDCDKAKGIENVLKHLRLKKDDSMSFGDGANDAEMLQFTRIGVAMGNSTAKAKKSADYITDDIDNDGWAKACLHYGLIDEIRYV